VGRNGKAGELSRRKVAGMKEVAEVLTNDSVKGEEL
jgi:hypothetical protein